MGVGQVSCRSTVRDLFDCISIIKVLENEKHYNLYTNYESYSFFNELKFFLKVLHISSSNKLRLRTRKKARIHIFVNCFFSLRDAKTCLSSTYFLNVKYTKTISKIFSEKFMQKLVTQYK